MIDKPHLAVVLFGLFVIVCGIHSSENTIIEGAFEELDELEKFDNSKLYRYTIWLKQDVIKTCRELEVTLKKSEISRMLLC